MVRDHKIHTIALIGLPPGIGKPGEFSDSLETQVLSLRDGNLLFFFTAGLTEARNGRKDEFGLERITYELEHSDGSDLSRMRAAVIDWMQGTPPHNDLTMISLRVGEHEH